MPEKMAEDLILCYRGPDDLVFDPFCGLATTCKMALLNHRHYLGMEIDEKYHRLAERRMKLAHLKYQQKLDGLLLGAASCVVGEKPCELKFDFDHEAFMKPPRRSVRGKSRRKKTAA
jgi:hypothetical protein